MQLQCVQLITAASIAADTDSIADAISFITGVLFCDQKTSFMQIRIWVPKSGQIRPEPDLKKSNPVQP